jgi:hypothetical protein
MRLLPVSVIVLAAVSLAVLAPAAGAAWQPPVALPATLSGQSVVATENEALVTGTRADGTPAVIPVDAATGAVGAMELLPKPESFAQHAIGPLPGDRALAAVVLSGKVLRLLVRTRGQGFKPAYDVPIPDIGPGIRRLRMAQEPDGTTVLQVTGFEPFGGKGTWMAVVCRPDGTCSEPIVPGGNVSVAPGGHAAAARVVDDPQGKTLEVATLEGRSWKWDTVATRPSVTTARVAVNASGQVAVAWGAGYETLHVARRIGGAWQTPIDVAAGPTVGLASLVVDAVGVTRVGYTTERASERTRTPAEFTVAADGRTRDDSLPPVSFDVGSEEWVAGPLPVLVFGGGAGVRDANGVLIGTEPRPTATGGRLPIYRFGPSGSLLEVSQNAPGPVAAAWRAPGAARFGATQTLDAGEVSDWRSVAVASSRSVIAWERGGQLFAAVAPDGGTFATTLLGSGVSPAPHAAITPGGRAFVLGAPSTSGAPTRVWRYTPDVTPPPTSSSPSPAARVQREFQRALRNLETQLRRALRGFRR